MDTDLLMKTELFYEDEYLKILRREYRNRKTPRYIILNKTGEIILGEISWYGAWRKFCFFPHDLTIWDNKCLASIIDILNKVNKDYKDKKE